MFHLMSSWVQALNIRLQSILMIVGPGLLVIT